MLENIQKHSINTALDEKPTMDEIVIVIKGLKDEKAPGGDGIQAEVWKYRGCNLSNRMNRWIIKIWEEGHIPQAWKDAIIVTIYKKEDRTECGNYRGIYLLSAAGKIFARILLNRLSSYITPEVVPETHCDFPSNRSTVHMIFCVQQFQAKCIEQDRPLYIVFVDFMKAFDTVGRSVAAAEEIWMPRKVLNHNRKPAYRNDGERQQWRGGLGYIYYNKRCQAGVRTGSSSMASR